MDGPVETFIDVAVREELLDAVIDQLVLDIWPVSHVELLVDCESPFIGISANSTYISLSSHVFTVISMAIRISIEKFLGFNSLSVDLSSNHTLAEALSRPR